MLNPKMINKKLIKIVLHLIQTLLFRKKNPFKKKLITNLLEKIN